MLNKILTSRPPTNRFGPSTWDYPEVHYLSLGFRPTVVQEGVKDLATYCLLILYTVLVCCVYLQYCTSTVALSLKATPLVRFPSAPLITPLLLTPDTVTCKTWASSLDP
jgi:hypothetical protein